MFTALILICLISDPTKCLVLADTEGPYKDRSTCIKRAYKMASDISISVPMYVAKQYMCTEKPKGIGV